MHLTDEYQAIRLLPKREGESINVQNSFNKTIRHHTALPESFRIRFKEQLDRCANSSTKKLRINRGLVRQQERARLQRLSPHKLCKAPWWYNAIGRCEVGHSCEGKYLKDIKKFLNAPREAVSGNVSLSCSNFYYCCLLWVMQRSASPQALKWE